MLPTKICELSYATSFPISSSDSIYSPVAKSRSDPSRRKISNRWLALITRCCLSTLLSISQMNKIKWLNLHLRPIGLRLATEYWGSIPKPPQNESQSLWRSCSQYLILSSLFSLIGRLILASVSPRSYTPPEDRLMLFQ